MTQTDVSIADVDYVKVRVVRNVGPYEVREYEAVTRLLFDPNASQEERHLFLKDAFFPMAAEVYTQAGLEFEVEEGRVIETEPKVEQVAAAFSGSQVEADVGASPPNADPEFLRKRKSEMTGAEKAMAKANEEWAKARYATHPHEFHDNRQKKNEPGGNSNWPDIKDKTYGIGVWF